MATAPDGREYTPTEPGPHAHTPNEAECTICCDIADTILDRLQAERMAVYPAKENRCPKHGTPWVQHSPEDWREDSL